MAMSGTLLSPRTRRYQGSKDSVTVSFRLVESTSPASSVTHRVMVQLPASQASGGVDGVVLVRSTMPSMRCVVCLYDVH